VHKYLEQFITETQNRFQKLRSCMDSKIYPIIFHWKTKGIKFENTLFIDFERAFNSTQRQILLDILKSQNIPTTLLRAILAIHT